jgi:hypothetical protein
MEFDDLSGYHFAMSMPYYEDMESVASGDNAKLIEKAKASGSVVFELTLDNGATLLGVKLDKRTTKFAKKIGAKYIAHGSTGAGNDQIRFDMIFKVLAPDFFALSIDIISVFLLYFLLYFQYL